MQRRQSLNLLAAISLATLGLTACAHRGVKPAAPAAVAKPAAAAPAAATETHAMRALPEAASTLPAAQTAAAPAPATTMAPATATATPATTASATRSVSAATSASAAAAASTTAAPIASTAATPASEMSGPNLPVRGMSMANVEHIFGAPLQKLPAVPDPGTKLHPPITRWIYPSYVVYFEYNYVVHTVLKAHPFTNGGDDKP